MTIAARDILDVARKVCEMQCEAGYRSAISRAYYSVYHGCLEWEKSLPVPGTDSGPVGGVHQQLINRLRNPAPEIKNADLRLLSRKVAVIVDTLRTKRKAADYLLSAEDQEAFNAVNCCAQAELLLRQIGAMENEVLETPAPEMMPQSPSVPEEDDPPPAPPVAGRPSLRRIR